MTFKPVRSILMSLASVALVTVAASSIAADAGTLATVNGKAIPSSRLDEMLKQVTSQQGAPKDSPELRARIKDELVNREILFQAAEKDGFGKSADVKSQIETVRQSIMIRAMVSDFVSKHPVTDADVKAEYDRIVKEAGDKEYHVRHILVATEDEAKAIIAKLKAGSSFEEMAKQSKDQGSATNGGDLDWATPAAFVKPFSEAMVALKKGQMTEKPVQTQFGYHIIKLDDVREAKIPAMDAVKKQIVEGLEQKKLQAFQEDLRKKAVVK